MMDTKHSRSIRIFLLSMLMQTASCGVIPISEVPNSVSGYPSLSQADQLTAAAYPAVIFTPHIQPSVESIGTPLPTGAVVIALTQQPLFTERRCSTEDQLSQGAFNSYEDYIGKAIATLPGNFANGRAVVLPPFENAQYGISEIVIINTETRLLWFEEFLCRDDQGRPYSRVLDVVRLPQLDSDEFLTVGCNQNGAQDVELAAITKYVQGQEYGMTLLPPTKGVWRASRELGKIESLPLEGVLCPYEVVGP